jgi:hypothetical protein
MDGILHVSYFRVCPCIALYFNFSVLKILEIRSSNEITPNYVCEDLILS